MKLLVIVNRTLDSAEVCDAIVNRAAEGPVQITLVASASSGAGSRSAHRTATAQYLERVVQQLREAGVPVDGVVGAPDPDSILEVDDAWDPWRFDEIVVSCRPWLSCRRAVPECGSAEP